MVHNETIMKELVRELDNDLPLAPLDRLDDDSRETILYLVDLGYLEFSEDMVPPEYEGLLSGPRVYHYAEVTDAGRIWARS
jgi:hypothetical protein